MRFRALLIGIFLPPFRWVFVLGAKTCPSPSYEVLFTYLKYWGLDSMVQLEHVDWDLLQGAQGQFGFSQEWITSIS